jgi:hypothetical protein
MARIQKDPNHVGSDFSCVIRDIRVIRGLPPIHVPVRGRLAWGIVAGIDHGYHGWHGFKNIPSPSISVLIFPKLSVKSVLSVVTPPSPSSSPPRFGLRGGGGFCTRCAACF